ncbi:MAG: hypothetical protein CMF61_03230 [Magnetococcales bacterium]|nr:hypothetical protein [Magnetococcales bacterium]PPR18232.1 MAG: HTH-type transcriptional regulator GltR [Pseudomonadota bacterium]|tara:strand:- start:79 stop:957 length:879 start_codon:yes stop_codon:yes gene_type:complete
MQDQNWDDYHYFLNVARTGSLKAAGAVMKVNQSTVFRRINALEEKLQVKLFTRHKQGYTLTEVGEGIFKDIEGIENVIHSVVRRMSGQDVSLSGRIKVSTTASIAFAWLPKYLKAFKQHYPDIKLDVEITQKHANLARREADVVISAGNSRSDTMIGRALSPIDFVLCAHKDYLKSKPKWNAGYYQGYEFLMPNEFFSGFKVRDNLMKKLTDSQVVLLCDQFSGLYNFCLQGMGVALLPKYLYKKGDGLIELEELADPNPNHIWILTHPDLKHTARIKVFMEFMRKAVKAGL